MNPPAPLYPQTNQNLPLAVILAVVLTALVMGGGRSGYAEGRESGAPEQAGREQAGREEAGDTTPEGDSDGEEGVPIEQVTPPLLLHFEEAPYPAQAREQGLTGAVAMALRVEADGTVGGAQVLEEAGHGFDQAALEAVNHFQFAPARLGDEPIPVVIRFTYRFTLEEVLRPVGSDDSDDEDYSDAGYYDESDSHGEWAPARGGGPPGIGTDTHHPAQSAVPGRSLWPVHGRILLRGHRTPLEGIGVIVRTGAHSPAESTGDREPAAPHGEEGEPEEETEITGETDELGRFRMDLPQGRWTFRVVHPEYESLSTTEEVAPNEKLEVTYYLERKSGAPYRSTVTARQARKTVTRTTLETMELVQIPGTFGEPFRVVQTLPGVARTPFGLGFVVVRGAAPEDTGFYIDGFQIPLLYHFLSGPAVFQGDLIESLDFYPGSFPVEYGGKMAGIITSTTKSTWESIHPESAGSNTQRGIRGKFAIDLIDVETLLTVPLGRDSHISAAFRRSHLDLLIRGAFPNTILPSYWDWQVVGNFALGKGWRGKMTLFGSSDELRFPSDFDEETMSGSLDSAMGISFHQAQFSVFKPILNGGRIQVSAMGGYRFMDFGMGAEMMDVTSVAAQIKSLLNAPLIKDHLSLDAGFDLAWSRERAGLNLGNLGNFSMDFPAPGMLNNPFHAPEGPRLLFEQTATGWKPGVFASLNATWGLVTLIPGVRMDFTQYGEFQDLTLDPRLVARVRLHDHVSLKSGVGIFHQPPGAIVGIDTDAAGQLTTPWAAQYTLGAEFTPLDHLDLDLTLFYNDYRDLVAFNDRTATMDGSTSSAPGNHDKHKGNREGAPSNSKQNQAGAQAQPQTDRYNNTGEGRAYGMELLIRHRPKGPFFGWIGYTLSRSERRSQRSPDWQLFNLDQTHILSVVGSYKLARNWTVGLKFQLVSGNPATPVVGSTYDVDTNRWVPVRGEPGSTRTPAFHQLDFRVDKVWTFNRWRLTGYLDILNVYNAKNTEFLYYNYDYSRSAPMPGIPFLPSLGVQGEF